jgi:hypothetical protein
MEVEGKHPRGELEKIWLNMIKMDLRKPALMKEDVKDRYYVNR